MGVLDTFLRYQLSACPCTALNYRGELPMINLFKKVIQLLNGELARYEQTRISAENEYQAMCCGTFNPRLLARIKSNNATNKR